MTELELNLIYQSIGLAQASITSLAWPEYPYGHACDAELENMYYRLNDMALVIAKKREALRGGI